MKTPLALLNLVDSKLRTTAAVLGVAFAVTLIFLQMGFLGATWRTASLIYDVLDFDLVLRSRQSRRLSDSFPFPRHRLYHAASVRGVSTVTPFYIGSARWRIPRGERRGYGRRILMLGARPGDAVFTDRELQSKSVLLTAPLDALIDRQSRPEFGPLNGEQFGDQDRGLQTEIGEHRVRIVDHFSIGASFEADGTLVVSDEGFRRLQGWPPEMVGLGLVKVARDVDPAAIAAELSRILPGDVEALTRRQAIGQERRLWLLEMSIGLIFIMGIAVAVVMGIAIVYQILSSDVVNHLPEYATLKAIGYGDRSLSSLVLQQAVILALFGFLPGLIAADLLYRLTTYSTRIPMLMPGWQITLVLGMTLVMCTVSGLAALRKLRQVDPADLY